MINKQQALLELVRAGLWANSYEFHVSGFKFQESVDWEKVFLLAEEQSTIGVVLAGIEHSKVKPPQELLLQWIGEVQMLEQQNKEMNQFIAVLIEKMRNADIYTLLVKGQGIAQCYERPLWRACGDVDFFLSDSNYEKAKAFLKTLASSVETEYDYKKHLGMTIDQWVVELHGSLRCGLSVRMDKAIDRIQDDVFFGGNVRSWSNGKTQVFLPGVDCDVMFVFTHFIKHFYTGGLGLRQICDWCRLLWTYKDSLNQELLKSRLRELGLTTEWKAFGAFAVDYLGMPKEAMPLYSSERKWSRKADRICAFIMEVGNFGHNRDNSYDKYPYFVRKAFSMGRRFGDLIRHARIFPLDSLRFFPKIMYDGLRSAARGE
ncbi:Uncharacterised nucleotidyltransferase [Prevotella communis]|uniref:Uncharacterized nucleotidyltransferase n=1 Tax=Prevotella communis TaxID=2913614 RepID=A0A1G7VS53_9BACT|nr:nucleotidyltransferase family protein [Prevotella communis]SDG62635.1 Uncharacterised nucleotidyltransferase [Prevotella communis]